MSVLFVWGKKKPHVGLAAYKVLMALCLLPFSFALKAQNPIGINSARRAITTAVPILTISPDARGAGMGETGVATSPDAFSAHWNPAKLAFIEDKWTLGIGYSPWLANLVNDMWISYIGVTRRLTDRQTVGVSFRYFNMGELQFTDNQGNELQIFNPREAMIDATFAQQLSEKLSIAGTARFIHSNLAGNISNSTTNPNASGARPGNTAAVDLSLFYKSKLNLNSMDADLAFGMNISNIGAPISYNDPTRRDYLPANLRIGSAFTAQFDEFNKLTFALDLNKLLVPTPETNVRNGADQPLMSSIFSSFGDAPDGIGEELQEVIVNIGAEYWYNNLLALRAGYFYENQFKGNRKFFSLGAGLRYQSFGLDVAYWIPSQQRHPLSETLRFSLLLKIGQGKGEDLDKVDDQAN
ncbi:type IX secretion system outer membrane channel protein PorV [Hugenholtzia roseola]|uniref:type IX secretion system outer membrane channel protein PorV n=1 Tax=Hugenholtzia roseola TaxID=1002 RepID=UPI00040D0FF3|nr:type IX secretion system outer membrane channel protein PorV [Hugenholtzia roseola]